jgi:replicative DNA helicase
MPGALDEIEAIGSRGGIMTGVPTGFSLDSLTNGLHSGQIGVIAARPATSMTNPFQISETVDAPLFLGDSPNMTMIWEIAVEGQVLALDGRRHGCSSAASCPSR